MKILIADDHELFRDGLETLLGGQADLTVVGTCADGQAAVHKAGELRPDIVLMDITMPGLNGIEATRQIVKEDLPCRVVVLSMHSDRRYVVEALRAGAQGFFLKNSSSALLIDGLRAVMEGEIRLDPKISNLVIREYIDLSEPEEPSSFTLLSGREREVLQHLAEGKSVKEISVLLDRSVKTIETHRSRIMDKVGIRTLPELTKYAVREGLTSLE